MASALSSLGIGSDGVLSYDIIDQLKEADKKTQISPIDSNLEENQVKQEDLSSLTTLAATLKSSTSTLSSELSYLKRSANSSDDAVSVSVKDGASVQDFTVQVTQLAKNDMYQSDAFSSETALFSSGDNTLTFTTGGDTYDIDVNAGTTLSELKDKINDTLDGTATASIINVGEDQYRLVLKGDKTGAENSIAVGGTAASDLGFDNSDNRLDTAQDANFLYNGINLTRSSNSVDDLMSGVTLNLNAQQDIGESRISITQDWSTIDDNLKSFVSQYNELMSSLKDATKYNSETNVAGTFQSSSEINSLKNAIGREILKVDENGRSFVDYGISLNDAGILEFDEGTFNEKVSEDPKDVEDFLRGSTVYDPTTLNTSSISAGELNISGSDFAINDTQIEIDTTGLENTDNDNALAVLEAINNAKIPGIEAFLNSDGTSVRIAGKAGADISITGNSTKLESIGLSEQNIQSTSTTRDGMFTSFNSLMNSYIDSSDGTLSLFEDKLQNKQESLIKEREKAVENLDTKYETMATRFAAYDSMINKLNTQFQSLSKMIDAQANNN